MNGCGNAGSVQRPRVLTALPLQNRPCVLNAMRSATSKRYLPDLRQPVVLNMAPDVWR